MDSKNFTQISEFLFLGLSKDPEIQHHIFGLFLSMYLANVLGNLLIILATISDSHLHTPMYSFLSNLSFVDICFTSTTVPKMLVNIQIQSKATTYAGCIMQIYFFTLFVGLENFLLAVMAYDWYVAICHPLHYMVIMNPRLCGLLVLVSWITSALNSLLQSLMTLRLSFCPNCRTSHPQAHTTWEMPCLQCTPVQLRAIFVMGGHCAELRLLGRCGGDWKSGTRSEGDPI
uniref:olfactory receptor 7A10-like n=1 Tax=Urocitellus parryii TaxID=9999 RepID=UPI000E55EC6C|nr:olfactory receptor 7A10-like [Urocitellus parryii]